MLYSPIQVLSSFDMPTNDGRAIVKREEWRGPHQGREFHLLREASKPLALLDPSCFKLVRAALNDCLDDFSLAIWSTRYHGQAYKELLVFRKEQAARVSMLARTVALFNAGKMTARIYTARFGLLLGYTHGNITAFMNETEMGIPYYFEGKAEPSEVFAIDGWLDHDVERALARPLPRTRKRR